LEALWFAALAAALRAVRVLPGWPVSVPVLVVGQEWVRDRWPFGGFPWGRLAFGQAGGPLLPLAALGGAVLVGFAAAAMGAALAGAVHAVTRRRGRVVGSVAVAAGVVAVAVAGPVAVPRPTAGTDAGGPSHAVVAAVQGNVPRLGL